MSVCPQTSAASSLLNALTHPVVSAARVHTVHSSLHGSALPRWQPKPDMCGQLHQSRPLLRHGQHPHRSTRQIQGPSGTVICLAKHCNCCQDVPCYLRRHLCIGLHPLSVCCRLLRKTSDNCASDIKLRPFIKPGCGGRISSYSPRIAGKMLECTRMCHDHVLQSTFAVLLIVLLGLAVSAMHQHWAYDAKGETARSLLHIMQRVRLQAVYCI